MKYVYVIYDPLYEKVLCVHEKANMDCNLCRGIREQREKEKCVYFLEEHKKLIHEKK